MNAVFLDTDGLIAIWDEDDSWHLPAKKSFSAFETKRQKIYTTSYVFLECGNAAARRPYRNSVARLRQKFEAAGVFIHPTEDDWHRAWAAYQKGEAGNAGIVDQVSFVVMRRLGITKAFTNDRHFQAAGFETLF